MPCGSYIFSMLNFISPIFHFRMIPMWNPAPSLHQPRRQELSKRKGRLLLLTRWKHYICTDSLQVILGSWQNERGSICCYSNHMDTHLHTHGPNQIWLWLTLNSFIKRNGILMILTVARKLNFAIFDYIVKHVILLCVGVGQLCCVYMEAVSATSPKTSIPLHGVTPLDRL